MASDHVRVRSVVADAAMAGAVAAGAEVAADAEVAVAVAPTLSKSQFAYDFIRTRVEDSRYTPGYRLVLGAIARELGVSVVPVREAIRRLEAEGLVQFERNVGAQVAMVDPREYEATMQTLSIVEGWATAASAPFMTMEDVARARAINDRLAESLHHFDPVSFTRLNLDFHSVLFEHCPNPHIRELVDRGWARLRVLRESTFSFVPGRARESVAEHTHLLNLIERGANTIELEFAARNHRLTTLEAFLAHEAARNSLREPQGVHAEPDSIRGPQGARSQEPFPEEHAAQRAEAISSVRVPPAPTGVSPGVQPSRMGPTQIQETA